MRLLAPAGVSDDAVETSSDLEGVGAGLSYGAMTFAIKPGRASHPHQHASEETWLVQSGHGYALIGTERVSLQAGSRVTVPSHTLHSVVNAQSIPLVVLGFWWRRHEG